MATSVEDFWRVFDREPVIFFVGSAISIFPPSNLPSATALVDGVVRALLNSSPLASLERQLLDVLWPRLETVLQEIDYCDPAAVGRTLAVLGNGNANPYHTFLAHHLGGRIPRVYTTNQDEMIERALGTLEAGRDIWYPGAAWSQQRLVKLHGTLSSVSSL